MYEKWAKFVVELHTEWLCKMVKQACEEARKKKIVNGLKEDEKVARENP